MKNPLAFPNKKYKEGTVGAAEDNVGMTLRDYFAARAMEAIIMKSEAGKAFSDRCELGKWAYEYADKMLKEREKSY
jgi:hypothetical protein